MKKRIVSLMLAVVAVLALCTSALAAPAKTTRYWQVYLDRGSIHWKGSKAAEAGTQAPVWQPAWLPEGWALEYGVTRGGVWPETSWQYLCGVETLSFSLCAPSDLSFQCWMDPEASDKTTKKTVKIQGYQASFWQVNKESALAWEDKAGNLFLMLHSGSLTQTELEKIANSVVECSEPLPDYRLGWTPVQDRELTPSAVLPSYVRSIGGTPDYIRFVYAKQPLNAPVGTPETVTVRGIQAQLWLGNPKETGTAVTSAVSGKTVELPTEKTWSTLIWTDPETGICFRIQGNKLSKETMLRMAESVEPGKSASSPAPALADGKTPASNAAVPVSAASKSSSADPNTSSQSWVADGWKAAITRADGTVEQVPSFSELFPGQELPQL